MMGALCLALVIGCAPAPVEDSREPWDNVLETTEFVEDQIGVLPAEEGQSDYNMEVTVFFENKMTQILRIQTGRGFSGRVCYLTQENIGGGWKPVDLECIF